MDPAFLSHRKAQVQKPDASLHAFPLSHLSRGATVRVNNIKHIPSNDAHSHAIRYNILVNLSGKEYEFRGVD